MRAEPARFSAHLGRRGARAGVHHPGAEAKGANERIGVGFIGTGGRAQAHMNIVNDLKQTGPAEPVAVCDVYRPRLEAASKKTGGARSTSSTRHCWPTRTSTWSASPRPTAFTPRRPSTPSAPARTSTARSR